MADEKDKKSLEMRLTKLEDAITKLVQIRKTADISAEEMKTYLKVHAALSPQISGGCISCYGCYSCYRCLVCSRCNTECTCGPCLCVASGGVGGGFSELGG